MKVRIRASDKGLQIIKEAKSKKGWKYDTLENDEPLIAASKILKPNVFFPIGDFYNKIYAEGINEASWRRFLMNKEMPARIFAAYCLALEISWESVADLSNIQPSIPLDFFPKVANNESNLYDASEFVCDVTIPDGMIFAPGEEFTKIWEIRNTGSMIWKDRYLTRFGAHKGFALIHSPARVKIPRVEPGDNVQIKVNLKAPEVATTCEAIWKMTNKNGEFCFPERYKYGLSVMIQVIE